MRFVVLFRFDTKPTKAGSAERDKNIAMAEKLGIKITAMYMTFGRYDAVAVVEAPDEKAVLKMLLKLPDSLHTETLLALSAEESDKLLG